MSNSQLCTEYSSASGYNNFHYWEDLDENETESQSHQAPVQRSRKRGCTSWASLGLPLGSFLVLVAILNTIFTSQSILNFGEFALVTGTFAAKTHLLYLINVGFLTVLTAYLWIAVIFTGRGHHISIWIAGSLLLLLLKLVISFSTLLTFLTSEEGLYWRKLWVNFVDIGTEVYIISVAVLAANEVWKWVDLRPEGQQVKPLPPLGLGPKGIWEFYNKRVENFRLTARILVILDIVYSVYILATEKVPEIFVPTRASQEVGAEGVIISFLHESSSFGTYRLSLIFFEDTILRFCRVVVGFILNSYLKQGVTATSIATLRRGVIAQIVILFMSSLIYLVLFGFFHQLTISDRFYQINYTCDMISRVVIVWSLAKALEGRAGGTGNPCIL